MVVLLTADNRRATSQAPRAGKARGACRFPDPTRHQGSPHQTEETPMSISPTTTRTPGPSTAPADGPVSAPAADPAAVIADARSRIDALDDHILGLVQERMAVSAVIQQTRIASGGRRVNLSREMEVLSRYRDALGRPGTSLAMTILELCRGRV
jgi:chorismate mutase